MKTGFRRFATLAVIVALSGCASRQKLAVETAGNWFKCPKAQVSATDIGGNQFQVAGCGKKDVFFCDYVTENEYTAAQHSELYCRPVKQAIEDSERNTRIIDVCAEACNNGGIACSRGCEDQACRNACDTLGKGCMDGCVSSQR